jgi:hypothetical protein
LAAVLLRNFIGGRKVGVLGTPPAAFDSGK